jgi:hypothetical protein
MERAQAGPRFLPRGAAEAPAGIELRHMRYFVALADAGSFTHAADVAGASASTRSSAWMSSTGRAATEKTRLALVK